MSQNGTAFFWHNGTIGVTKWYSFVCHKMVQLYHKMVQMSQNGTVLSQNGTGVTKWSLTADVRAAMDGWNEGTTKPSSREFLPCYNDTWLEELGQYNSRFCVFVWRCLWTFIECKESTCNIYPYKQDKVILWWRSEDICFDQWNF